MNKKNLLKQVSISNEVRILPAIIGAEFTEIGAAVREAEFGGADAIHIDVMDGHFAPNITFGISAVSAVRRITHLPLDVHLMIAQPERCVADFISAGADTLTVHVEACFNLYYTLQEIRKLGARVGVAINPATPASTLEEILLELDVLLVMTVNPGFSGFIERTLPKIQRIRKMLDDAGRFDVPIEVDGGINVKTAPRVVEAGACQLVSASAVYSQPTGVAAAIAALRSAGYSGLTKLEKKAQ